MTPKELAETVGVVSARKVKDLIRKNEIEHYRIAGRVFITVGAWETFVESRKVTPCPDATAVPSSTSVRTEDSTTSSGPREAGAASAALARQTLSELKSSLRNGSKGESGGVARLIPPKSA
jgi:hypothetical protein